MKTELFCLTLRLNLDNQFRRFTGETADGSLVHGQGGNSVPDGTSKC